jgi:hypothetical protein
MTERAKIREKLLQAHRQENSMNIEIGKIDKEIKELQKRKKKLAGMVSSNMKYRNGLIKRL